MDKLVLRRAVQITASTRPVLSRSAVPNQYCLARHASSLPSITQSSFWKSLIPKPFRRRPEPEVDWGVPKKPKSKEWNPATFYIVIFLFIGSMSIQMIALRRDFDTFMRKSEVHIGLLREVVEKLQRGEEVDVEKALGTGNAQKESGWEEVLKEIERDDILKNIKPEDATQSVPDPVKTKPTSPAPLKEAKNPEPKHGPYSNFF